jgi:hypothetical protein
MILKGSISIARSPGELWPYIQNLQIRKEWDPRIRAVVPVTGGEPSAGSQFRIRFKLTGIESNFKAEVIEYNEPERFVLNLSGGSLPAKGYIQDVYELKEYQNGTLVKNIIEIQCPGLKLFLNSRILASHLFLSSFKRELRALKDFAEASKSSG